MAEVIAVKNVGSFIILFFPKTEIVEKASILLQQQNLRKDAKA